jgi:hypothetical protein
MTWSPEYWAFVWATRLGFAADNPQCRSQLRKSIRTNKPNLSSAMPSDIMDLIEELAPSDDAEELRQLIPHLTNFANQRDNS